MSIIKIKFNEVAVTCRILGYNSNYLDANSLYEIVQVVSLDHIGYSRNLRGLSVCTPSGGSNVYYIMYNWIKP